ncbi:INO80 complex subunit C [Brachyhypopomus gauderio]|uniref:INO80 complex subunit C n=1 Tax=Brachyhypopomus gauderio TaxID=698409 RepID=UPI0040428F62
MAAPFTTSPAGELSSPALGNVKLLPVALAAQARGKKRPASPAAHSAPQPNHSSKRKKLHSALGPSQSQVVPFESVDVRVVTVADVAEPVGKPLPFKDPSFVHSGIGGAAAGKKNRTWKNLKQIQAAERALPWKISHPNYYNIDAPPSLKPPKKYSDISGLPANYTDPQTKLRFTSSEEFSYIRLLPTDVVAGYLALRKASCVVP